jgi:hypothetical protein
MACTQEQLRWAPGVPVQIRFYNHTGAVTWHCNDIYIAHFANGSVEWRIGLAKEGRIGRLALGPQY